MQPFCLSIRIIFYLSDLMVIASPRTPSPSPPGSRIFSLAPCGGCGRSIGFPALARSRFARGVCRRRRATWGRVCRGGGSLRDFYSTNNHSVSRPTEQFNRRITEKITNSRPTVFVHPIITVNGCPLSTYIRFQILIPSRSEL